MLGADDHRAAANRSAMMPVASTAAPWATCTPVCMTPNARAR